MKLGSFFQIACPFKLKYWCEKATGFDCAFSSASLRTFRLDQVRHVEDGRCCGTTLPARSFDCSTTCIFLSGCSPYWFACPGDSEVKLWDHCDHDASADSRGLQVHYSDYSIAKWQFYYWANCFWSWFSNWTSSGMRNRDFHLHMPRSFDSPFPW